MQMRGTSALMGGCKVTSPPKLLSTYRFDTWEFKGDPPLDGYGISVIPKICASCLPSDIGHAAYVIGSSMRTESRCDVVLLVLLKQARRGRPSTSCEIATCV